ncbi:type IIL restriction-modification enzyme MmeI [Chryseobacterium carnipullorum]|uniref:type IIL restriction-modification enzyme MmeI n=1 Tax=Chryseobacterium carnipullorum TaxID=1124835 RepID=UPI000F5162B0|nr:type IIL restriction-modification enzyme MmeI [Chryseobacterium carnipullorum]
MEKDNDGNEIIGTYALRKPLPQKWWIYGEKRPALYNAISELDQVMVLNRHAKYLLISICKNNMIFSEATIVFAFNTFSELAILNSSIHDVWAWKNSSTMGASTLRYSGTNAFETFPFPTVKSEKLNSLGNELHLTRLKIMKHYQLGLTDLQNIFHNIHLDNKTEIYDDIIKLREIYKSIDFEIIKLYKWNDIDLKHYFYELNHLPENDRSRFTINPTVKKEILKRLLLLNLEQSKSDNLGKKD